jgi:hypothetical protein
MGHQYLFPTMTPKSLKRLSIRLGGSKSSHRGTETQPGSVLRDHTSAQQDSLQKIRPTSPRPDKRRFPPERDLSGLPGLPTEILLSIVEDLDDATLICLSATSYRLSRVLSSHTNGIRERDRSRCAKWLIMAQLERGMVVDPRLHKAHVKLNLRSPQNQAGHHIFRTLPAFKHKFECHGERLRESTYAVTYIICSFLRTPRHAYSAWPRVLGSEAERRSDDPLGVLQSQHVPALWYCSQ